MVCIVTVFYCFIYPKSDESINILYSILWNNSAFLNYNDFYKFFSFFTVFLCYIVFDLCVTCRCSVCNASSGSFSRKYQSGFIGRLGSGGFYIGLPDPAWCVDRIDDNDWKQNICLRTKEKLIFIGIALLCVAIEQIDMIAVVRALQQSRENDFFMLVTIFVFVLFLFMIMLLFIYNLGVEREKNNKLLEENLLSHMESQQYEQILASVKELRIMKHDVKNHLDVLQTLLVGNHTGQAVDYMRQITADLNKVHYTLSSGNTTVDCIVSNKQSMAENVGILTENIIYLPEEIPLSDVEICSLLGNLYDNAIEGCMRAESKRIWLYMKPFHNMLSIKIVNTSDGGYRFNSRNELLSTKAGKGNQNGMEHGIGLKRIREIVERHFGIMEILPEKEMFSVNILIPLHQGEQQT